MLAFCNYDIKEILDSIRLHSSLLRGSDKICKSSNSRHTVKSILD